MATGESDESASPHETPRTKPGKQTSGRSKQVGPTKVVLVRHGTTPTTGKVLPGRAKGLSLSERGREEATKSADRLGSAGAKPAAIYTSPMERARETAAAFSARFGIKPVIDRRLNECDFGAWTGQELRKLAKLPEWRVVQNYPSIFRFPDGESFLEMQARLVDAVKSICDSHPGQDVIVVSHGDPIKAVLADALGAHLNQCQRITVQPASISVVSYGTDRAAVLCTNSLDGVPYLGAHS